MRETENRHHDLELAAGPCSITKENFDELYDISEIMVLGSDGKMHQAATFVRCVGVKSRTELVDDGQYVGMDADLLIERIVSRRRTGKMLPSVLLAQKFANKMEVGYCFGNCITTYSATTLRA